MWMVIGICVFFFKGYCNVPRLFSLHELDEFHNEAFGHIVFSKTGSISFQS